MSVGKHDAAASHMQFSAPLPGALMMTAAALLAAAAWLLAAAPPPPPPRAVAAPSLCSAGLAYEPDLSLADFTARYKVAFPTALLLARSSG